MSGKRPAGPEAVIFDDDHYYMASVLAELLVKDGMKVTYVTPASVAAAYTVNTMEQKFIQARLIEIGVAITRGEALSKITSRASSPLASIPARSSGTIRRTSCS